MTPVSGVWNEAELTRCIDRKSSTRDRVRSRVADQLRDVVNLHQGTAASDGDPAPLGIQWCLAPPDVPLRGLQEDGHPQPAYTLLPPVPRARRMWAGGELTWHGEIRVGDIVTRESVVKDIVTKEGRSGPLCLITVTHHYSTDRGLAIAERQDIVYRLGEIVSTKGEPAPGFASDVLHRLTTSTPQLFRYSALTGNAHRIHYDHPYATGVEGYPALVVHGPLQATMLMHAAALLMGSPPARFSYRAISPVYCGESLSIVRDTGKNSVSLAIVAADARIGMRADVTWGDT